MSLLDIPVEFGSYGCGKTVARIGVKMSRNDCNPVMADETFCGRRLSGKVIRGGSDEMPNQTKLLDSDTEVSGIFDVKSVHLSPEHVSISLSFGKKEVKGLDLEDFVGCSGRLIVNTVSDIPDDAEDEDEDEDEDDEAAEETRSFLPDGPWRGTPLSELFNGGTLAALAAGKLGTLGELVDYIDAGKKLVDLDDIGPGKAQRIADRIAEFAKEHPEFQAEAVGA